MDQRIVKIQQIMRENFHRELCLGELAQSVNLSVFRLSHIFRSQVGVSPIQYLRQLRMERARCLLEASFLSVKEIAHQVGLKDSSHFARDFKETYGEPPTRYRLRFKSGRIIEAGNRNKSNHEDLADQAYDENERRSATRKQLVKAAMQSILLPMNVLTYLATVLDLGTLSWFIS